MSDLLPYESQLQQQWTDLPLPEEDAAWEDMRKRLEEDDDDKGIFFWRRPGCAWWILLPLLASIGWWLIRHEKFVAQKPIVERSVLRTNTEKLPKTFKRIDDGCNENSLPVKKRKSGSMTFSVKPGHRRSIITRSHFIPESYQKQTSNRDEPFTDIEIKPIAEREEATSITASVPDTGISTIAYPNTSQTDSIDNTKSDSKKIHKRTDTVSNLMDTSRITEKEKKNKLYFSAGIGLQQQLPIDGQKANPYNSVGRKSSLADYIPSPYLRLHYKDKWFIQAEFRYGASQYSKEFLYQQSSIKDTGRAPVYTTNSASTLKKTFYHQLPVSFQYQALPNWWIGGGLVWNKFYAAISDMETVKRNNRTQMDSIVFKGLVSVKKDTGGNFASSYFQATVESQYRWKRFTIGARYAFGLQPYIRFSLPNIGPKEERNSSFQTFIRFEIWRSRKGKDD